MRLIDADDLKMAFEKVYPLATNEMGGVVNKKIYEIINNAPTVTPDKIQALMSDYLIYRCEPERPQGEWIGNAFDEHHCNRCGHPALWEEEPDGYYEVQSNFCPNCGAKMKGGVE